MNKPATSDEFVHAIPLEMTKLRELTPSGQRLADAIKSLLAEKDFNSITTLEIAKQAKANESLIYKYFGDKRGLLHHVLGEWLKVSMATIQEDLRGWDRPVDKLRQLVWRTVESYKRDPVVARILLVEARTYPGYFQSDTYRLVLYYLAILDELIDKAKNEGQIRSDIPTADIRKIINGALEHMVLPGLISSRQINPGDITSKISKTIFEGLLNTSLS